MLVHGILNPHLLSLLARVRHTNTLVIADRGFPSWPGLETIDLALVDDVPRVLDVYAAVAANFVVGRVYMAEEFERANDDAVQARFRRAVGDVPRTFEPHDAFKRRVPSAVGLVRTGDTVPYANMILVSA